MPHDDPFIIDLFGNTALSSGFDLGVTAFGHVIDDADDDHDLDPSKPAPAMPAAKATGSQARAASRRTNFYLPSDRQLAKGWKERARDNIAAIRLAAEIEAEERTAAPEEQEKLIRFVGFGASDLANGVFRRLGEVDFRKGWNKIGADLEDAIGELDYASLARCTQYAHFTPEFIVRAIWSGLQRLRHPDPGQLAALSGHRSFGRRAASHRQGRPAESRLTASNFVRQFPSSRSLEGERGRKEFGLAGAQRGTGGADTLARRTSP
jgi:adenine-specific DNA methylase